MCAKTKKSVSASKLNEGRKQTQNQKVNFQKDVSQKRSADDGTGVRGTKK